MNTRRGFIGAAVAFVSAIAVGVRESIAMTRTTNRIAGGRTFAEPCAWEFKGTPCRAGRAPLPAHRLIYRDGSVEFRERLRCGVRGCVDPATHALYFVLEREVDWPKEMTVEVGRLPAGFVCSVHATRQDDGRLCASTMASFYPVVRAAFSATIRQGATWDGFTTALEPLHVVGNSA